MNLQELIQSNINIIQCITHEDLIIQSMVDKASISLGRAWYKWNNAMGLEKYNRNKKIFEKILEPEGLEDLQTGLLPWFQSDDAAGSIVIVEEFNQTDNNEDIVITNLLKQIFYNKEFKKNRALILSQTKKGLPYSLSKKVYQWEIPLPDKDTLGIIFTSVCKQRNYLVDKKDKVDIEEQLYKDLIEASLGLTILDAERSFNKMVTNNIKQNKKFTQENLDELILEKEAIIRNSGYLEYYHHRETLSDIGGSVALKDWLRQRQKAFDDKAREYGLPIPRGLLLIGIPGTGKSLFAKSIGAAFGQPIIKMDIGKIFAGIVGESESNMRQALKLVETIAPAVLWIDEIEKGLSGMASSGSTDGGTTSRVLGTFLTWMQEKDKPIFVVATANDISGLPPEFLRKGRFDEIFFLDLPNMDERKEIIKIHINKNKRNADNFDIEKLVKASKQFSGAEIEEAIKEALFMAYDKGEDINTDWVEKAIMKTYPLSRTMKEKIEAMRKWAEARAVFASGDKNKKEEISEDISVINKLDNPLI